MFSAAWKAAQLRLVPAECFYEPYYASGTSEPERYRIWMKNDTPLAIAGLWRDWPNGKYSFTILTVNSERYELMALFHKPGKEKRSVVILPPEQADLQGSGVCAYIRGALSGRENRDGAGAITGKMLTQKWTGRTREINEDRRNSGSL